MHLTKATMDGLDRVIEILKDGRNQLAERGIDQWQGDYPNPKQVEEDINKGVAYLVHSDDHETVGAFSIVPAPDPVYDAMDGKWQLNTDQYLVIHRVAIHSAHAGKGYASGLFNNVIDYIKQNRPDILSLRIDTHEDNVPMQHLIEKERLYPGGDLIWGLPAGRKFLRLRIINPRVGTVTLVLQSKRWVGNNLLGRSYD